MLTYTFDPALLELEELTNGEDVEFRLHLLKPSLGLESLKRVQDHFEDNAVITDAMFYTYPDYRYRVIVRREYRAAFLAELLKHRLLRSASWQEE